MPLSLRRGARVAKSRYGGVPEWLKGADCKSVGLRLRWFESIPLHQAIARLYCSETRIAGGSGNSLDAGGCSSMVEQKPSKLTTRVRFPSPAPQIVDSPEIQPMWLSGRALPW